jgi:hypothetical protein
VSANDLTCAVVGHFVCEAHRVVRERGWTLPSPAPGGVPAARYKGRKPSMICVPAVVRGVLHTVRCPLGRLRRV